MSNIETKETEKKGFDLKVHHIDPKTQRMTKITPYTMYGIRDVGEFFERGGKFYYANNEEVTDQSIIAKIKATKHSK